MGEMMREPVLHMLIGVQGVGKSTFIKNVLTPDLNELGVDYYIHSTDDEVQRRADEQGKTYNQVFDAEIGNITGQMYRQLEHVMFERNKDIIWDQVNHTASKRKKIFDFARWYNYRVYGYVFPSPTDLVANHQYKQWRERLISRPGKIIPSHVMINIVQNFIQPTVDEGFQWLNYVDFNGKIYKGESGEI